MSKPITYQEYLQTDKWKKISKECKSLAGFRCSKCSSSKYLQAHHITYENIGNENQEDLVCLCRACHELEHGIVRRPNFKMIGNDTINFTLELAKLSKAAGDTFEKLYIHYDRKDNGKTTIEYSKMNRTEQQKFKRGLKELIDKKMIKKISNNAYIFNPDFIINPNEYENAIKIWDTL